MSRTDIHLTLTSRRTSAATLALDHTRATMLEKDANAKVPDPGEDEHFTMSSEGTLIVEDGRVTLEYAETKLTGMEGSITRLSFDADNPGLITMLREGTVETVLVFERGKQHICSYLTPYMPFEITVRTYRVVNELLETGSLFLDYTVEIRGARLERNRFSIDISPVDNRMAELLAHEPLPAVPDAADRP